MNWTDYLMYVIVPMPLWIIIGGCTLTLVSNGIDRLIK